MISLPPLDPLQPLERFGLEVLIDLARCPPVEDAAAGAVRLVVDERDPDLVDLRNCIARDWYIERGDGAVRIPWGVLHRIGEIATAATERRSTLRDRHGRVPSSENELVRQGLSAEPVVNRAAVQLREAIVASAGRRPVALVAPWPDGKRWAAAITHDLDVVDLWPVFTALRLAELLRKGELGRMTRILRAAAGSVLAKPVRTALQVMLDEEHDRGIVSSWFILCGTPTLRTMRAGDLTYRPEGRGARDILRELTARNCEIGLHGSFATSDDHELFGEQRRRLAGLTGSPVAGVRQHFLRMQPGKTIEGMAAAGFRYDTTFGFPDRNGFRLGIGDVVRGWDGTAGESLDIDEAPVIWMDRALSKYAGVEDPEQWIDEGEALAKACREVEGLWVGVWHPNLTPALGFPDAPAAFANLLDRLLAADPYIAPLGSLVEWRAQRRQGVVKGIRPDGKPDATVTLEAPPRSIPATP